MKELRKKNNLYSFQRVILSKKSYAKKFAGNNKALYDLLMDCFNHKIETVKCNPGKETKTMIKKQYITFRLNQNNRKYILRIINGIEKDNIIITFAFNQRGYKTVTIKCLDDDKDFFAEINGILFKDTPKKHDEVMRVYDFVNELKAKNTSIKMIYDQYEIRYYINTADDNILYDLEKKLFPSLEEMKVKLNVLG